MLHDPINVGSEHLLRAAQVAFQHCQEDVKSRLASSRRKIIIAVSGESGSGKTTISYHLSKMIMSKLLTEDTKISVKHLFADNLYVDNYEGKDPAGREERIINNAFHGIGPEEYDWPMIEGIVHCFRRGYVCRMPCVDVLNQQIDFLETDFSTVDILIFDGLYAIDPRMKADFCFWIKTPYYSGKSWDNVRDQFAGRLDCADDIKSYADSVIATLDSNVQQDIRGKERLTAARIIRLEKEHRALQEVASVSRGRSPRFWSLSYTNAAWNID